MNAQGNQTLNYGCEVEHAIGALADGVEAAVNIDALLGLAERPGWSPDAQ